MATAIPAPVGDRLKRNAIGLPSAMAMSLAFISPTIGVIFISALIANQAGASAPFAFIIGTIGVLLMANTLAEFTKRVPSAGTFYTFAGQAGGRYIGFIVGWLLFLTYAFQSPINTNLFGYFVPRSCCATSGSTSPPTGGCSASRSSPSSPGSGTSPSSTRSGWTSSSWPSRSW